MSDRIGPWRFDRSEKYEPKRVKGGPMFSSDLGDLEKIQRMKKRAEIAAILDAAPVRKRKPVPSSVEHPTKEPSILEQLVEAKRKAGKLC